MNIDRDAIREMLRNKEISRREAAVMLREERKAEPEAEPVEEGGMTKVCELLDKLTNVMQKPQQIEVPLASLELELKEIKKLLGKEKPRGVIEFTVYRGEGGRITKVTAEEK